jgi:hypothetical protein
MSTIIQHLRYDPCSQRSVYGSLGRLPTLAACQHYQILSFWHSIVSKPYRLSGGVFFSRSIMMPF